MLKVSGLSLTTIPRASHWAPDINSLVQMAVLVNRLATLFRAPCTCECRLLLRQTASRPRQYIATTPAGVCIRIPRRMRPQHPSASRLRRNTEDPALPPPPRPPRAAVNIYHHVHTWPLPLATWWTPSHPSYLPTLRPADILGEPLTGRFAQLRKNTAHALQTLGKSGRSLGSTACMRWLNSTTLCQLCANCQQHTR